MSITVTSVASPAWADASQTSINCTITTQEFGTIPFTASSNDSESYAVQIYNDCVAGTYGTIAAYVTPAVTVTELEIAAQELIDQQAVNKSYSDATTCISYVNSTNTTWSADASALSTFRDDMWAYVFSQETVSPLPSISSLTTGIQALSSYPNW